MAAPKPIEDAPREGRRERKRRQTRMRIEGAAMALFLDRGFDATTIEDITEAADVSKRSFFDYFPSKEEVVFAWQDSFADALADAIAARPPGEPLVTVVEEAVSAAVMASFDPQSLALAGLIRQTPALRARDHLKYAKLESRLTEALATRSNIGDGERRRVRLLSAVVIGTMRVGGEEWQAAPQPVSPELLVRALFSELRSVMAAFGADT
jgi:AcrR family transcriptional regulator